MLQTFDMPEEKKYRINELLDTLSVKDNRRALSILPGELGISIATFNNYRAINKSDPQDIPHTIVAKLEQFFSLAPGELQNFTLDIKPISDKTAHHREHLTEKFNLTK